MSFNFRITLPRQERISPNCRQGFKSTIRRMILADANTALLAKATGLPLDAARAAIASGYIIVQSPPNPETAHIFSSWIESYFYTNGVIPNQGDWKRCGNWIHGTSTQTVDVILRAFGLDFLAILNHYGWPQIGEKYKIYIGDVIGDETLTQKVKEIY